MTPTHITVTPSGAALGAEIGGVDLAAASDDSFAEIRQALLDHQVIVFRDQRITPDQQLAFCRRMGALDVHPFSKPMAGYPEILEVRKEPGDEENFGGAWHTDMSYNQVPPKATFIYAREVPETGGDTIFADMYAAYEALDGDMKARCAATTAIHGPGKVYGAKGAYRHVSQSTQVAITGDAEREVEHPLVRSHPETGRKSLFMDPPHILRFKGLDKAESKALLKTLARHAIRDEFLFRLDWRPDTVAIWDNRCTMHHALNDYAGQRRIMHRTVIAAEARPA